MYIPLPYHFQQIISESTDFDRFLGRIWACLTIVATFSLLSFEKMLFDRH